VVLVAESLAIALVGAVVVFAGISVDRLLLVSLLLVMLVLPVGGTV